MEPAKFFEIDVTIKAFICHLKPEVLHQTATVFVPLPFDPQVEAW
jgi:hypothetical protein